MRTQEEILRQSTTIASVGASPDNQQVANRISRILQHWGYRVIPVNPLYAKVIGEKCYPNLLEVPGHIDIVAIYRRSENVAPHVDEAISISASAIWMPLSVVNEEAAAKAHKAGLDVVMNRCIECTAVELGVHLSHTLQN